MYTARQITILIAAGLMATCGPVQAYLTFTNQAPEGASWFAAGNWRNSVSPFGSAVPTIADQVYINNTAAPCTVIVDGPGAVTSSFLLGHNNGIQANLKLVPGGELYVSAWGYVGYSSAATFEITGGVFSGATTIYLGHSTPEGPPIEVEIVQYAGNVYVTNGSSSTITMNDLTASQNFAPGYPRYRLVGGRLQNMYWSIGSAGYAKVEVEGGTNAVRNSIRLGAGPGGNGVYLQSGGLVQTYRTYLGSSGAKGRYELSGGYYEDVFYGIYCGDGGEGTFVQSGGTNTSGKLYIGGPATGTGLYQISGGTLKSSSILLSTNGTFEITGNQSVITCDTYLQTPQSALDLRLTNGTVSCIAQTKNLNSKVDGTLNVTLLGPPDSYPDRSSVVTIMTHGTMLSGTFKTVNLAPAKEFLSVRVNYNAGSITLDQWKYARGSLLTIR